LFALIIVSLKAAKRVALSPRIVSSALVWMLPAMVLAPVMMTVNYGQINLFIVLMVLTDLTCVIAVRGHTLPRGVLVGVAAAIKLTPFIFIPFLFLTRQFRAGCAALASFCLCTVGALALAPHSSWLYWTKEVFDSSRVGSPWFRSNQNLLGALDRLFGATPSSLVVLAATMLCAIAGLAVAVWAHRRSSPLLGILLCATTGLIVSPISWSHHYVWVIPVLAWLALAADRPRWGRWWALLATLVFVAGPQLSLPPFLHHYTSILQFAQGNAFFLSAVAFVVLSAAMIWGRRRRGMDHQFEWAAPKSSPPFANSARGHPKAGHEPLEGID
jgi:alpha-1,2-mannosyltransferase